MKIRTKLIAYFLVIVVLVPVIGGIAMQRLQGIDGSLSELNDNAVPRLQKAQALQRIQREQQSAALNYMLTGNKDQRQAYLEAIPKFDTELAAFESDTSAEGKQALTEIQTQRRTFTQQGAQLVQSRNTIDTQIASLNQNHGEIVRQLNSIRGRFAPQGGSSSAPQGGDVGQIPVGLRNQVNDLLLGTEQMLHMVALEFSVAANYVVMPNEETKKQLPVASEIFASGFTIANNAGGPEDKAILVNVQTAYNAFETSVRAIFAAADTSARARVLFSESSEKVAGTLAGYVDLQTKGLTAAREQSHNTVSTSRMLIISITVIGVLLSAGLGFVFARNITLPLVHLRDIADRVSTGNLDNVEVDINSQDEIGDLADAFRRMITSVKFLMMAGQDDEDDSDDIFGLPAA